MAEISSQAVCAKQLSQLAEVDVIEFVDDAIHYLKGNRVPFLSKYSESEQIEIINPLKTQKLDQSDDFNDRVEKEDSPKKEEKKEVKPA